MHARQFGACVDISLWTQTNMFHQEGPDIHEMVMFFQVGCYVVFLFLSTFLKELRKYRTTFYCKNLAPVLFVSPLHKKVHGLEVVVSINPGVCKTDNCWLQHNN